jgi:hypothetical protein
LYESILCKKEILEWQIRFVGISYLPIFDAGLIGVFVFDSVLGFVFLVGVVPLIQLSQGAIDELAVLHCDAFEPAENKLVFEVVAVVQCRVFVCDLFVPSFEYLQKK